MTPFAALGELEKSGAMEKQAALRAVGRGAALGATDLGKLIGRLLRIPKIKDMKLSNTGRIPPDILNPSNPGHGNLQNMARRVTQGGIAGGVGGAAGVGISKAIRALMSEDGEE